MEGLAWITQAGSVGVGQCRHKGSHKRETVRGEVTPETEECVRGREGEV